MTFLELPMKSLILLLATLALFACGQDDQAPPVVDLSNTTVVWEGNIQENSGFMVTYNHVKQCLEFFDLVNNAVPPYMVVTEKYKTFICGGQVATGCALFITNTIYVPEQALEGTQYIFKHELVHIISRLDDHAQVSTPFVICAEM